MRPTEPRALVRSVNSFEFHNQIALHKKVHAVADVCQLSSVVNQRYWNLSLEGNPALGEFIRKASRIRCFQQSRAERLVNSKGRVKNLFL